VDTIDRQILECLQVNARISNAKIARKIGMAPSGVLERIRKLEERGVIRGYDLDVDPKQVGLGVLCYIFVKADKYLDVGVLAAIPEVLEVHHIAGEDCFMLKARVADNEALGTLLETRITALDPVISTRTTIVLSTVKETTRLPLNPDEEEFNG